MQEAKRRLRGRQEYVALSSPSSFTVISYYFVDIFFIVETTSTPKVFCIIGFLAGMELSELRNEKKKNECVEGGRGIECVMLSVLLTYMRNYMFFNQS